MAFRSYLCGRTQYVRLKLTNSDLVQSVWSFRNLDIHLDSDITPTVSCCFAVLQQIRSISQIVSQPVVQSLIVSLVISRLDYSSWRCPAFLHCCTERPSHGAFYDRRSRFLCRCRSSVEQPPALGGVIRVPSVFESILRQFHLLTPSRQSNTFLRFILSPHLFCSFTCFSFMRFSLKQLATIGYCLRLCLLILAVKLPRGTEQARDLTFKPGSL